MLEQKYDEFDAEMERQLRAKEAAAMVEAEAQRKAQIAEMAANYATEAEQKASRRRKRRRMRGRGRARVKEKGGSVQLNPDAEEGQEGGAGQETKGAAAANGIEVEVSSKVGEERQQLQIADCNQEQEKTQIPAVGGAPARSQALDEVKRVDIGANKAGREGRKSVRVGAQVGSVPTPSNRM